jgi:glycosyltransferase involved in cell wall biosynthesis
MSGSPPRIAIISNSQTPYRMHVHQRIIRELTEVELWSLFTHETSNSPWSIQPPPELRPVYWGSGEKSEHQDRVLNQGHEWKKGGSILRWIEQSQVRFVVLEGYNDLGRLRILWCCRRLGIPCFVFGDNNILADRPSLLKSAVKRPLLGTVVQCATGVFYCGRLGRDYFRRYGAEEKRMFPFPYEPDYAAFESVPDALKDAARERYQLRRGRRYLIYSGRFAAVKRVDLLLQAFSEAAPQRPDWDLLLIGDGPLRKPLLEALPEQTRSRIVCTGFISDSAMIAALYKLGDVLILPSDFEPWGVVVTEAAMAPLALICSSVTGSGVELVRDGVNGRLFPAGDCSALRDAMLDVTKEENIDAMKAASLKVLAEWRRCSDPIDGLRASLRFAGTIQ